MIITALTIVFVEYFDTGLPWWGVILSIIINLIVLIPICIMMAICNVAVSTNIVSALVGGFIWPGKMIAVVIFKILTFNTTGTALVVLRDMKLGHYMVRDSSHQNRVLHAYMNRKSHHAPYSSRKSSVSSYHGLCSPASISGLLQTSMGSAPQKRPETSYAHWLLLTRRVSSSGV